LQKGIFIRTLLYAQNSLLGGKHPAGINTLSALNFDSDIQEKSGVKFIAALKKSSGFISGKV
jgi:hypothetical protein